MTSAVLYTNSARTSCRRYITDARRDTSRDNERKALSSCLSHRHRANSGAHVMDVQLSLGSHGSPSGSTLSAAIQGERFVRIHLAHTCSKLGMLAQGALRLARSEEHTSELQS